MYDDNNFINNYNLLMSLPFSHTTLLPAEVLERVHSRFMNFEGTPFSFIETSHRSTHYDKVNTDASDEIKRFFCLSDSHQALFLPTGASIPSFYYNILAQPHSQFTVFVVNTGANSKRDYEEFLRCYTNTKMVEWDDLENQMSSLDVDQKALIYFYKTDDGKVRPFPEFSPFLRDKMVLVSNFNYRVTPLATSPRHDIICLDTETGLSIPGFSIVLIKKQLLASLEPAASCPDMMNFPLTFKMKSVVNTPYTLCTLVLLQNLTYILENSQKITKKVRDNRQKCVTYLKEYGVKIVQSKQLEHFLVLERESLGCEWKNVLLTQFGHLSQKYAYFFIQASNDDPKLLFKPMMTTEYIN